MIERKIRARSGSVDSDDVLVEFLYLLLRDHVLSGDVESIMNALHLGEMKRFSNGWLARYAEDIALRLRMTWRDEDEVDYVI